MGVLGTPVSFIATTKIPESRHFYETVLGFECLSEDPFAIVFQLEGTKLRIQKVDSIPKANFTVLGWMVTDIRASIQELSEKGVRFDKFPKLSQDDLGVWHSPSGALIAWFNDPDGNTLSITEG